MWTFHVLQPSQVSAGNAGRQARGKPRAPGQALWRIRPPEGMFFDCPTNFGSCPCPHVRTCTQGKGSSVIRSQAAFWNSLPDLREILSRLGMVLSVVGMVLNLITGFGEGSSTPATPSGDSGYEEPGVEQQAELDEIRNDINLAIKHLRHNEEVPPVFMDLFDLQRAAQAHAETVAVTGKLQNSEQNVTMLQHHLPESGASGHAFLDAWLHSQAHTEVILDPRHVFYGIGVAVGHGEVWVAVQFSDS